MSTWMSSFAAAGHLLYISLMFFLIYFGLIMDDINWNFIDFFDTFRYPQIPLILFCFSFYSLNIIFLPKRVYVCVCDTLCLYFVLNSLAANFSFYSPFPVMIEQKDKTLPHFLFLKKKFFQFCSVLHLLIFLIFFCFFSKKRKNFP